ncbi:SDR family oxidoreductase [Verticiella sediminum]|uniref:SDR family oxidoreductase n=1 Tax=Verticiella sediminum TaxID=1247510 RepID=A0A556AJK1_9BURK|nr:SDR family NAD(P)-dependent oxidoreductase [Verticiella sediminum]TSH93035.1 SDR family oxidoreductase [Verticiella sediminum]
MKNERTAAITGGASGIGLESARLLGQAGVALVLLDRSDRVHEVAASLRSEGMAAEAVVADLSELADVPEAARRMAALRGGVDILVNNAGVHPKVDGRIAGFEQIVLEDWEFVFRVNSTAPFLLCQALLPAMKEKGWGRIVNIASRAGRTLSPRAGTHYSASKAALIGMTRKLAGECAPFGVTANCIAPGQVETPLARTSSPEVLAEAARRIPVGRLGDASEIASAVAYLASDGASFVTGAVLDVNGGESML